MYDCPAEPYRTINIDPNDIEYRLTTVEAPYRGGLGQVKSGEWDSVDHQEDVLEHPKVQSMIRRFGEEKEWGEIPKYQNKTRSELEKYDRLFASIKQEGFKPNHHGSHIGRKSYARDRLSVLVVIGRDGEIYQYDGSHRFGIAYVQDIEIPVHIVCRHKQWQEMRDEICKNGLSEKHSENLRCHPDLQDVL